MRILYVSAFDHPGAGNRVLVHWLKWLDMNGYDAYVACPAKGWLKGQLSKIGVRKVLNAKFFIPEKRTVLTAAFNIFKLIIFTLRNRIDVIHCNSDQAHYMACVAARITGRPIVTHLRFHYSLDYHTWMFRGWRRPDMIILVSQAFRKEEEPKLKEVMPNAPIRVLHNCIDPKEYPSVNLDKNGPSCYIFYPAAIASRKRQSQLFQIDATLQEDGLSYKFLAAGRVNEKHYWDECKKEAKLYPNAGVCFLGHVDSVVRYYKSSFLSVTLSAYETFGYSVLESMMCGVPVVGYKTPAVQEILQDGGVLVDQNDTVALAKLSQGWRPTENSGWLFLRKPERALKLSSRLILFAPS